VTEQNLDTSRPYIWLRYATQYSRDGQTHTMEMSVPVPLGASAEQREVLFREAEAGMNQLVNRFGQRVSQTLQGVQDQRGEYNAALRSAPVLKSAPPQQPKSSMSAPQIAARSLDGQRQEAHSIAVPAVRSQEPVVPSTHPNIGASMPKTLGPSLDSHANVPLPEFIQYIHEHLNLTPRQAMDMLKVKSLSTGINLREALERLRHLAAQSNARAPSASLSTNAESQAQQPSYMLDDQASLEGNNQQEDDDDQSQIAEMRVSAPVYFDEEEDPEIEDEEDVHLPSKFMPQQLEDARNKINGLREAQGATLADPKRLQALGNVIGGQISPERLQELIIGIWNVSALKKLKVDQLEALISWAKQDDFAEEVEAALAVLEEDRHARGNR
jgi:hypothetical protein